MWQCRGQFLGALAMDSRWRVWPTATRAEVSGRWADSGMSTLSVAVIWNGGSSDCRVESVPCRRFCRPGEQSAVRHRANAPVCQHGGSNRHPPTAARHQGTGSGRGTPRCLCPPCSSKLIPIRINAIWATPTCASTDLWPKTPLAPYNPTSPPPPRRYLHHGHAGIVPRAARNRSGRSAGRIIHSIQFRNRKRTYRFRID